MKKIGLYITALILVLIIYFIKPIRGYGNEITENADAKNYLVSLGLDSEEFLYEQQNEIYERRLIYIKKMERIDFVYTTSENAYLPKDQLSYLIDYNRESNFSIKGYLFTDEQNAYHVMFNFDSKGTKELEHLILLRNSKRYTKKIVSYGRYLVSNEKQYQNNMDFISSDFDLNKIRMIDTTNLIKRATTKGYIHYMFDLASLYDSSYFEVEVALLERISKNESAILGFNQFNENELKYYPKSIWTSYEGETKWLF